MPLIDKYATRLGCLKVENVSTAFQKYLAVFAVGGVVIRSLGLFTKRKDY